MNTEDLTPRSRQRDIREKRLKYFTKQNPESIQPKYAKQKGINSSKDPRHVFQPPDKRQPRTNKSFPMKQQQQKSEVHSTTVRHLKHSNSNKSHDNAENHSRNNADWCEEQSLTFNETNEFSDIEDDLSTHRPDLDTSRTTELLIESCRNYKDILLEREQEKCIINGNKKSFYEDVMKKDAVFDYEVTRQKLQKSRLLVAKIESEIQSNLEDSDSEVTCPPPPTKFQENSSSKKCAEASKKSIPANGSFKVALTSDQIYELAKSRSNPHSTPRESSVVENVVDHYEVVKQFQKDVRRSSELIKRNNDNFEKIISGEDCSEVATGNNNHSVYNSILKERELENNGDEDGCINANNYDSLSNVDSCLSLGMLEEHLKRIGVDPNVIRWAAKSQPCVDINPLEDSSIEYFRRCPECLARNKCSVTWCLNCGSVLIGLEPEAAPKSSKRSFTEHQRQPVKPSESFLNQEQSIELEREDSESSSQLNLFSSNNNNNGSSTVDLLITKEDANNVDTYDTQPDCDLEIIDMEENDHVDANKEEEEDWSTEDCFMNLSEQLKLTLNESVEANGLEESDYAQAESSIPVDISVLDDADYREMMCSNNALSSSKTIYVPPLNLDMSPPRSFVNGESDQLLDISIGILDSSTKRSDLPSVDSSNRFYDKRMSEMNTNNSAGCNKTTDTRDLGEHPGAHGGPHQQQQQDNLGRGDANRSARQKKNFYINRKRNDSDRTYTKDKNRYMNRNRNQSENLGSPNESHSQRHRGSAVSQRRWSSSSHQWSDHHPSVLQKKPADYLRQSYNRSNHFQDNTSIRSLNADGEYVSRCLLEKNSTSSDLEADNLSNRLSIRRFSNILPKYDIDDVIFTPRALARIGLHSHEDVVSPCQEVSNSTQEILKPTNPTSTTPKQESSRKIKEMFESRLKLTYKRGWQEGDSPWLYLPDEIWLRIFKKLTLENLSSVSASCSTLHRIAQDISLWRTIHLHRHHNLSNDHMASIGRRKPTVLSLQNCHGDNITLFGLKQMFLECADSLKRLSFVSCSKGAFQGDQLLLLSAVYCQNLREVDASYAQNVRDTTVASLAEASLCLQKLHLNGAQNITDEGIAALINYHKESLLSLELYGCFNLTSNSLRSISECSNLRSLSLGSLTKLSGTSISLMTAKLSCLQTLDLRGAGKHVVDATICEMASKCANMENLVLANIDRVTDRGVEAVAEGMPKLRSLDLCGCTRVGNKGVEALAKKCLQIEELDLSSTGVDEKGVVVLANYSNNSLRCLRMNFCKNIGKESLKKLVTNCKKLESIYLYGNHQVRNTNSLTAINNKLIVKQDE